MSDLLHQVRASALDPERAGRAFEKLAAAWPPNERPLSKVLSDSPDCMSALTHLLSISPAAAEKLIHDPAALLWLSQAEITRTDRSTRRMIEAYEMLLHSAADASMRGASPTSDPFDERFTTLRRWKQREMLRIALREVASWSSVEQTTLELTRLAEICVQTVVNGWMRELTRRWGAPQTDFAVLAMGKFGGEELNYSSDIDVIFFYAEEGQVNPRFSHQEFFTRLAEKIIGTFGTHDAVQPLFRIDLRLRPEGASGALVRTLDSLEQYYSAFGETWERMALIKARTVGGSSELGYEFSHRLQPFVFPRSISHDVVDEITSIKQRIEREIVGQSSLRRNVKLGYGGIREIEFVAQTLQILHGARHPFLQERNTLKALRALRQLQIIPHGQMESLIDAYRFLRTVEHRLQIENEAQTHTLPEKPDALERLARSLGFPRVNALQAALAEHTGAVREIFNHVLRTPARSAAAAPPIDLTFFQSPEQARRLLGDLDGSAASARFSPRTRKLALQLEPSLLDWMRRVADPDAALTRFVRFVDRYGARGLLFETLLRNPRLLELLVRLFDASRFMSEIVLRRPQLVEEIARGGTLGQNFEVADYLRDLAQNDDDVPWNERVRIYKRAQLLRIGLRDILGFATLSEIQREYTALAEACLIFIQQQVGLASELTIVALGKFGGRELTYGADLDVIFIGRQAKAAAQIIRAMSEVTAEGAVFSVDARLRPEGEAGPLACTLESYAAYFATRAQTWEAQALGKARPIAGPAQEAYLDVARSVWRNFGQRPDLWAQIATMHGRVVRERAAHDDFLDFKTGLGGLMHLEFFAQGHQMRSGLWNPNTLEALDALVAGAILSDTDAKELSEHYLFLRRCEAALRRLDDKSISRLPPDPLEQRHVAVRCGLASREDFLAKYRAARAGIAELCRWPVA